MFRTLYGGAADAAFHINLEFGSAHGAPALNGGGTTTPPGSRSSSPYRRGPAPRLELDWSSSDDEAAVVARLARGCASLAAAHAAAVVRVALLVTPPPPDAAPAGAVVSASDFGPRAPRAVELRLTYAAAAPVLRALTFTRTSGSGAAPESLVAALLAQLDTSTVVKLKLCDGLGWAAAAWAVQPRLWASLGELSLGGCGLSSLPPMVGDLAQLKVGGRGCGSIKGEGDGCDIRRYYLYQ
jgi:hypothetical protein